MEVSALTETKHDHMYYRFESLLLAIELFTQRFDMEHLSLFSFDFVNEILTLNASALFIRDKDQFILKQKRLYAEIGPYSIADTEQLRQLATFRGHIITKDLDQVLDSRDIEALQIQWIMPLITDDILHGFIVANGNQSGEFTDGDLILSSTVMRLINNSLENSKHLLELQVSNAKLDHKNFNLFAINQSTKVLLSEMSLSRLHETATDIFSEVTTSQVTAFGIVDSLTLKLKITGFRNVLAYTRYFGEFEMRTTSYNGPVVLHIDQDRERLEELFVNYGQFSELEAHYIILIIKNSSIMGMVTLSRPVNDERKYDDSIFELVESLANSAVIAISNAISFEEANRQRINAQNKLRLLQTLNRLVKNINECSTPGELCYFTLKTMQLAFRLKKAFICLRSDQHYVVEESIGLTEHSQTANGHIIHMEDISSFLLEGRMLCDYTNEGVARYLPAETVQWAGSSNCCIIAPLAVANKVALDDDLHPLGFLIILETESSLLEEETLLVETIAGNISPILYQMNITRALQQQIDPAGKQAFLQALKDKIFRSEHYMLPFCLQYKRYDQSPFATPGPAEAELAELRKELWRFSSEEEADWSEEPELYAFDGYLFAFSPSPLRVGGWCEIPVTNGLSSVMTFPYVNLPVCG
ncbi:MAG: hypothetical protein K0R57_4008 [Paenibacillaceae bacterium]|jgi:GAF domain-containing protein|nr:hypothetical protein [Paenibacillaceae bacterium]